MTRIPDVIETKAGLLRPLSRPDLPDIARQLSQPGIAKWLAAIDCRAAEQEADALLRHSQSPTEYLRVIEIDGRLAGCLCLGAGLWYWLDTEWHGQGIMQRALQAGIGAWFGAQNPPLIATCRDDNSASLALLHRLGFSASPTPRKMFFRTPEAAFSCRDHIMTPEQWLLLNPPQMTVGHLRLRPVRQQDAKIIAGWRSWPPEQQKGAIPTDGEQIVAFIEKHRVRTPAAGLFIAENDLTAQAVALLAPGEKAVLWLGSDPQIGGLLARFFADQGPALRD